jgi:hypothetical protein
MIDEEMEEKRKNKIVNRDFGNPKSKIVNQQS